jgi:hypothetical protein
MREHLRQLCLLRLTPDLTLRVMVRGARKQKNGWIHDAIRAIRGCA